MKRVMYIDCFSGAAGDMLLGALLDAGLPLAGLRAALGSLGVEHELRVSKVVRAGVTATKVVVVPTGSDLPRHPDHHHPHDDHDDHHHPHEHGHHSAHAHRAPGEIVALIDKASLPKRVRDRAVDLVTRLAEAEAAIHNMPVEKVHLHEVGAVDSIIDIVGCVWGLDWFKVDAVVASPMNVGSGSVRIAHGQFPVPAPATLRLLANVPIYSDGPAMELTTPTGALLVTGHATAFGAMPPMTVEVVGYGAGSKDFSGRPNVLRVLVGTAADEPVAAVSPHVQVVKIECAIDDMNPQFFGPVSDLLFGAGALDVLLAPVQMKKQRPGTLVTVVAPLSRRAALVEVLFRETTTIGVRYGVMAREILERQSETVATPWGAVRVKVSTGDGQVRTATPEFDDCVRLAKANKVAVKVVHAEALRAWQTTQESRATAPRTGRPRLPSPANRPGRGARTGRSGPRGRK